LRWTLYEQPPTTTFFDVDSAQNWKDFCRAFAQFTGPGQNVVYADVDGHIGYHATGRVPLRRSDVLVPVNGADDAHEWSGYIPFEAMANVFDPPSGVIATANSRITPDQYPYTISTSWDGPPYRVQRIYRLLSANRKFTAADMLAIQTDIFSSYDLFLAQRLTYAIDHAQNATQEARAAADILRGWDGRVTPDSAAPTIIALARRQLWKLLLEPHLGAAKPPAQTARGDVANTPKLRLAGWTAYRWPYSAVALENIVERQPARWLPSQFHSYDELLAAAVTAAISDADDGKLTGKNWHWGRWFPLTLQHPIFGSIPLLSHWSGPGRVPQAGDAYTVKAAGPDFGPSERMTVDFADLDHSTMNIVTGESGNLFSPNYMDQWKAWYGGTTFAFPFSPAAVHDAKAHELTLTPVK
jgi:penicillin amidase